MAGSGSDNIVAFGTGLRRVFGCFGTRVVSSLAILGIAAGAGVPVVVSVTAPCGGPVVTQGSAFDFPASFTGFRIGAGCFFPVMTESVEFYLFCGGRHKSIGILIELAAAGITAALVVLNIAGGGAVGFHSVHLGQMVGADMAGCGSDLIAADGAGLCCVFGCRSAGGVRHNSVLMSRIAGADMSMTVGTFVTPFTHIKVVIIIERSVRNLRNGTAARIKQRAAEGALLILVPTLICTVGSFFCNGCKTVGTADLDVAGCRHAACLGGDDRFAGGYRSYLTGGINGCYSRFVGRPSHCISRVGRCDSCHQSFSITDSQSQFVLVECDAGCRLGSRGDSDGRRFNHIRHVLVVDIIEIGNNHFHFQVSCCGRSNLALEGHNGSGICGSISTSVARFNTITQSCVKHFCGLRPHSFYTI